MVDVRMRRPATALAAAILMSVVPGDAFAKGSFKGRFDGVRFTAKRATVECRYTRSIAFLDVNGVQSAHGGRVRRFAVSTGTVADPFVPGAVFPLVLTDASTTFGGGGKANPLWTGTSAGGLLVQLTGYKRGKLTGTVRGTLQALNAAASGSMEANATFTAKCAVQ